MDRAAMKKMQDILEITHVVIFFFLGSQAFSITRDTRWGWFTAS